MEQQRKVRGHGADHGLVSPVRGHAVVYPRGQKMDGGVEWTSRIGSVGCSVIGYAQQYGPTWWTSLTDVTNKVWHFDWSQNPNTIWVELKNLNFDEGQRVKVLNPRNPSLAGEVSRAFEPVE